MCLNPAGATAADAGLTFSEGLALIALMLAVLGLVLAPIWVSLNRQRRRARDAERELRRKISGLEQQIIEIRERRVMLAMVVTRGFMSSSNALDAASGLLHRVLSARTAEIDGERALESFQQLKRGVDRAWAEARLMTDAEIDQRSALQQLMHRLGDEGTEDLLQRGRQSGGLESLDSGTLSKAAAAVRERREGAS